MRSSLQESVGGRSSPLSSLRAGPPRSRDGTIFDDQEHRDKSALRQIGALFVVAQERRLQIIIVSQNPSVIAFSTRFEVGSFARPFVIFLPHLFLYFRNSDFLPPNKTSRGSWDSMAETAVIMHAEMYVEVCSNFRFG